MLVLSRKIGEKIVIDKNITLIVVDIRGDRVRLGIDAPPDVTIHRQEVAEAIKKKLAENTVDEPTQTEPQAQPPC